MTTKLYLVLFTAFLAGCSANPVTQQGSQVELHAEKPKGNCKSLGEVSGGQGNWFTGDYTSNENLLVGARNTLRNRAADLGGNYVWVQNTSSSSAWGSLGTSNVSLVGVVFRCE